MKHAVRRLGSQRLLEIVDGYSVMTGRLCIEPQFCQRKGGFRRQRKGVFQSLLRLIEAARIGVELAQIVPVGVVAGLLFDAHFGVANGLRIFVPGAIGAAHDVVGQSGFAGQLAVAVQQRADFVLRLLPGPEQRQR